MRVFNSSTTATLLCTGLLFLLLGCKAKQTRERDNVQINTATSSLHEITIDDKQVKLLDSTQYRRLEIGQHILKIKDMAIAIDVKAREQVLINVASDTIIMEEVVYNMVYNGLPSGVTQHYKSPITIFSLRGLKYAGPYTLFVNEPVIKGWDFGIGQKPFSTLGWDDPEYRGAFHSDYYKLNTVSEFISTRTPLNYINEWIEPKVLANVIHLEPGYKLTVEQGNFLVIASSKTNKVSVCKLSTDINDEVVIREVTWYNKEEHGKIIRTIATIGNFIIQNDESKKKNTLDIVISDNSSQPHLRIVR